MSVICHMRLIHIKLSKHEVKSTSNSMGIASSGGICIVM